MFLAGAGIGSGLQEKQRSRRIGEARTSLDQAKAQRGYTSSSTHDPMTGAPLTPGGGGMQPGLGFDPNTGAPLGTDPMDTALQQVRGLGLGTEDMARLEQEYAVIRREQDAQRKDMLGRQGLAGRATETIGMDPIMEGPMTGLIAMIQNPAIPLEYSAKVYSEALLDFGRYQQKKGERTAQTIGAIQMMTLLNSGKLISQTISDPDTGLPIANPAYGRIMQDLVQQIAESGMAGITGFNSEDGMTLEMLERYGMSQQQMAEMQGEGGEFSPAQAGGPGGPSGAMPGPGMYDGMMGGGRQKPQPAPAQAQPAPQPGGVAEAPPDKWAGLEDNEFAQTLKTAEEQEAKASLQKERMEYGDTLDIQTMEPEERKTSIKKLAGFMGALDKHNTPLVDKRAQLMDWAKKNHFARLDVNTGQWIIDDKFRKIVDVLATRDRHGLTVDQIIERLWPSPEEPLYWKDSGGGAF